MKIPCVRETDESGRNLKRELRGGRIHRGQPLRSRQGREQLEPPFGENLGLVIMAGAHLSLVIDRGESSEKDFEREPIEAPANRRDSDVQSPEGLWVSPPQGAATRSGGEAH